MATDFERYVPNIPRMELNIPCICWGRNARYAEHFKVGERCAIWGRIQSREYMKKLDEENVEKRVAFEVSVSKLELLEEARESIV